MKLFLKILAGIGALVVIAIVALMFLTAGMSTIADEFFLAAKSNNYDQAYSLLSEDFKTSTSKTQLKSYMEANAFSSFKEASWESRSVNGGRGELAGSISTDNGGVVPVSLGFVKGGGKWKIYSINKPRSGIKEETTPGQMPSEGEQVKLVRDSMHVFAVAVKENSMKKMHAYVSHLWQNQFAVADFDDAFNSFYQFGDAFMALDEHTPQFSDSATIDEDGVLVLQGLYTTEPDQVHFEHRYIYEGLGWKLVGINVRIN